MTVLTRTLRHLTVKECLEVYNFRYGCRMVEFHDRHGKSYDLKSVTDQPEIIQEWYSEWLRDDHYPLSPVDKDHADDLWEKFCEEVAKS